MAEDFDTEWGAVQEMFPGARFSICFDKETLASELAKQRTVFIVIKHRCYCYEGQDVPNTYVQVNKKPGAGCITYADAVQALVDYDYNPCEHDFLQRFTHIAETIQYEAHFGC